MWSAFCPRFLRWPFIVPSSHSSPLLRSTAQVTSSRALSSFVVWYLPVPSIFIPVNLLLILTCKFLLFLLDETTAILLHDCLLPRHTYVGCWISDFHSLRTFGRHLCNIVRTSCDAWTTCQRGKSSNRCLPCSIRGPVDTAAN